MKTISVTLQLHLNINYNSRDFEEPAEKSVSLPLDTQKIINKFQKIVHI